MVALPVVKAALVLTMNVALLAPAGIVTLGGTVATFVSEDPSAMRTPAAWAFPIRETVPVDGDPPTRLNGLSEGTWRVAGSTVNEVFTATPPLAAEIVMGVGFWTPAVVTANVANVAFAGTVTLADVVATVVSELASVTTSPPVGATVERLTLPVAGSPPETTAGSTETEAKTGGSGVTTSVPVWLKPKYEALMAGVGVRRVDDRRRGHGERRKERTARNGYARGHRLRTRQAAQLHAGTRGGDRAVQGYRAGGWIPTLHRGGIEGHGNRNRQTHDECRAPRGPAPGYGEVGVRLHGRSQGRHLKRGRGRSGRDRDGGGHVRQRAGGA